MLLEFSLGSFWVWIFLNETISEETFFGGTIVMVSVAVYSFLEIINSKIKTPPTWRSADIVLQNEFCQLKQTLHFK